jgi:hypothetical protein
VLCWHMEVKIERAGGVPTLVSKEGSEYEG